jgi:hypothetical protein
MKTPITYQRPQFLKAFFIFFALIFVYGCNQKKEEPKEKPSSSSNNLEFFATDNIQSDFYYNRSANAIIDNIDKTILPSFSNLSELKAIFNRTPKREYSLIPSIPSNTNHLLNPEQSEETEDIFKPAREKMQIEMGNVLKIYATMNDLFYYQIIYRSQSNNIEGKVYGVGVFKDNIGYSVNAKLDQQTILFLNELNKESILTDEVFFTFIFTPNRSMVKLRCNNGSTKQKGLLQGYYELIK